MLWSPCEDEWSMRWREGDRAASKTDRQHVKRHTMRLDCRSISLAINLWEPWTDQRLLCALDQSSQTAAKMQCILSVLIQVTLHVCSVEYWRHSFHSTWESSSFVNLCCRACARRKFDNTSYNASHFAVAEMSRCNTWLEKCSRHQGCLWLFQTPGFAFWKQFDCSLPVAIENNSYICWCLCLGTCRLTRGLSWWILCGNSIYHGNNIGQLHSQAFLQLRTVSTNMYRPQLSSVTLVSHSQMLFWKRSLPFYWSQSAGCLMCVRLHYKRDFFALYNQTHNRTSDLKKKVNKWHVVVSRGVF